MLGVGGVLALCKEHWASGGWRGGQGWLSGPLVKSVCGDLAFVGGKCSSSGGNMIDEQGNDEEQRKPNLVPLQPATAEEPILFTGKRRSPQGCSKPFQR